MVNQRPHEMIRKRSAVLIFDSIMIVTEDVILTKQITKIARVLVRGRIVGMIIFVLL